MTESKPFASLSPSLLARKGEAKPAMRRQAINIVAQPGQALEDLGWNDMGHEPAPERVSELVALPGVEVVPISQEPAVHEQLAAITREFELVDAPVVATDVSNPVVARAAPGSKAKAAFTLRLDPGRHLQLRLVCAVKHKSAQQIVTQALDAFLAAQHEITKIATSAVG